MHVFHGQYLTLVLGADQLVDVNVALDFILGKGLLQKLVILNVLIVLRYQQNLHVRGKNRYRYRELDFIGPT